MAINFGFATKFAAEQLIKQAMNYMEKDPEKNFPKVMDMVDKIALTEKHHKEIASIREAYQTNPSLRQFVKKFFPGGTQL